jgi:hypothetical protein
MTTEQTYAAANRRFDARAALLIGLGWRYAASGGCASFVRADPGNPHRAQCIEAGWALWAPRAAWIDTLAVVLRRGLIA